MCELKIYTYPELATPIIQSVMSAAMSRPRSFGVSPSGESCLLADCQLRDFAAGNLLAFTSEVLLWHALVRRCHVVHDPRQADLFLVPFWLATATTLRWGRTPTHATAGDARSLHRWLGRFRPGNLTSHVVYLASHPRRHVFLCSTDSQFVYLGPHGESPGPERESIWVHLGDDQWTTGSRKPVRRPDAGSGWHMQHGLAVPYRISQWLPFGFPPPRRRKSTLLFSSLTSSKHPTRSKLADALRAQSIEGVEGAAVGR